MGTRHTRERLFEVMIKVDPDFKENLLLKEYFENPQKFENVVNEIDDVDDGHDEEQQEITPEEQQKAQELNKKAETAVESDDDINKPVVDDSIKGLDFTVTVPTYKKRLADQNIESLRKLARRLRIPEPEVTEGAVYQKRITEPCEIPPCDHYLIDVYDLNIKTDSMFKFPGNYKLVAVVDNMTSGSIEIDKEEIVPKEYLQPSGECNLCNQERYRGKNFIVKDGNSGKYLRLGSSCVKKYIGVNPAKYIRTLDYLRDFMRDMDGIMADDDLFGGGGGGRRGLDPSNRIVDKDKVISILHDVLSNEPYVKREWEYPDRGPRYRTNDGKATADKAEKIIYNREELEKYPINTQYVTEFKEFAKSLEPLPPNIVVDKYDGTQYDKNTGFNEYRAKIKVFGSDANFRIKDTAFLASAINFFENEKKRAEEAKERKNSEWVGQVGSKFPIQRATLTGARTGQSDFGPWYLWTFIDDSGNLYKKFGTLSDKFKIQNAPDDAEQLFGFKKGDVFAFTAEIKKHEEYQGTKITQLGRLSKL